MKKIEVVENERNLDPYTMLNSIDLINRETLSDNARNLVDSIAQVCCNDGTTALIGYENAPFGATTGSVKTIICDENNLDGALKELQPHNTPRHGYKDCYIVVVS